MSRTLVAVMLAAGLSLVLASGAEAKSTSSSRTYHSRSSGTHGHASSTSRKGNGDLHFIRKTCKTAACKKKHPTGSYEIPIRPKKHR